MSSFSTPKLGAYAILGALGLMAGVVFGRVEPVILAAPFLVVLAFGLPLTRAPELEVELDVDHERALEGDDLHARIKVSAGQNVERLEVLLELPPGIERAGTAENPQALRLRADEPQTIDLLLRCAHWDAYRFGQIVVRARDRLGLVHHEASLDQRRPLRVYPRPEQLNALLRPLETRVYIGNQVSRAKGEGIEFTDLREFEPGDRIRRINWRASARRGELWVNEAHPERNADIVLFIDTFGQAERDGRSTLDLTVRAAATLADRYLRQKDRVGFVSFGGTVNWLVPSTGLTQLYQILDSLMESEITLNYAWKDTDLIPRQMLPAKALVVALTPLLDKRAINALYDLRQRGFDLAIVDVSPVDFQPPGTEPLDALAHRLWTLHRGATRSSFVSLGVPVATWHDGDPFAVPLSEVTTFRRAAGPARA